jgi:hypothetical protein
MTKLLAALALAVAFVSVASAQGYIINTPGQPPSYYQQGGQGGGVINTPGRPPTYVDQTGQGGYVLSTPGQAPTYVTPTAPTPGLHQPCTTMNCLQGFGR